MEQKWNNLTKGEQDFLKNFSAQTLAGEMEQAEDLKRNCNVSFQYAKTHSTYIKDWEQTKAEMEEKLRTGNIHSDFTPAVWQGMINITDQIINDKLQKVREDFQEKFGESIYNYLGKNGKTKSCLGVVLLFVITSGIITLVV